MQFRHLITLSLLLTLSATLIAQAPKSGLQRLLDAELARIPAKVGLHIKHLPSGEEASFQGAELFNSASVIKIPVMVMAYQMADRKQLNLDERFEMKRSDYRGGSGVLRSFDPGASPTIRDLITQMIITSDNSATDIMIAKVGGTAKVNEWLSQSGYKELRLNQTTYELFRKRYELLDAKYKNLTTEDVFAVQMSHPLFTKGREALIGEVQKAISTRDVGAEFFKHMEKDQSFWLGAMSPRDTSRMLEAIEKGTAASKEACDEMRRIMRQQLSGARRIPHFLNVGVGHKTGDFPPAVANDVGVIYARSGAIVISFFTQDNRGSYPETEDRMGLVSRMIVDYFDGIGQR